MIILDNVQLGSLVNHAVDNEFKKKILINNEYNSVFTPTGLSRDIFYQIASEMASGKKYKVKIQIQVKEKAENEGDNQ